MVWINTDVSISDDTQEGGVCRLTFSFSDGVDVVTKHVYARPDSVNEAFLDRLAASLVSDIRNMEGARAVVAAKAAKVVALAASVLPVKEVKVDA